jgi:hypothetical protein
MAKKCAILLLWIMTGVSSCHPAVAQECFYRKHILYKDGTHVEAIETYDCNNSAPPQVIVIEKEVPAKNRTLGDFLFGVEEDGQGASHVFSTLVSVGVF